MPRPRQHHETAPLSAPRGAALAPSTVLDPVRTGDHGRRFPGSWSTTPDPELLAQLIVASGRGDQEAFGRLYDLTSPRIHALSTRALPTSTAAEMGTRQVYLTVWSCAATYSPATAHPLVWLITLAHHTLAEHRADTSSPARGLHQVGLHRPEGGPWSGADAPEVSPLSRTQEDVLTLVHLGGYSHRQVAGLLGLSRSTVSAVVREGYRRLLDRVPAAS